MADTEKLQELNINISLAISSSASSVDTEKSMHEYTEDFHSSLQTSFGEISNKSAEISTDCSAHGVNVDEYITQFVGKKLQVLKENRVIRTEKSSVDLRSQHNQRKLNQFWLKKLEILRSNTSNQTQEYYEQHINLAMHRKSDNKCTNKSKSSNQETNVNEIGAFQSACERIRFNNLRERCKKFLERELHSSETCIKCKRIDDDLRKNEFYTNCVRKVKKNIVEEKLAKNIDRTSSALLIAKIIEDGPKPSWSVDEIWNKLLLGGYQHTQSKTELLQK